MSSKHDRKPKRFDASETASKPCPECLRIGRLGFGVRRGKPDRGGEKVQRYCCPGHGYYYDPDLTEAAEQRIRAKVNDYLFRSATQKDRAEEIEKSRQVLIRRLKLLRRDCMDDLEIVHHFKPEWYSDPRGGVIAVDATALDGTPYIVYLAFDVATGDPVCYLLGEVEDEDGWRNFFRRLDKTGYQIRLLISDGGPLDCIIRAASGHYQGVHKVIHQLDWVHELHEIEKIMPLPPKTPEEARRRRKPWQNDKEQLLYGLVLELRSARNEEQYERIRTKILKEKATTTQRAKEVVELLENDRSGLKARYEAGCDCDNSDICEYSISRFKMLFLRKKRGIHVKSRADVQGCVNVLWAAFRVKPMDDSERLDRVGRATLELAHASVKRNDIWQFRKGRKKDKNAQKVSEA